MSEHEVEKIEFQAVSSISLSQVEAFKNEFNLKNKYFKIDNKGARALLEARVRKEVYDMVNKKFKEQSD